MTGDGGRVVVMMDGGGGGGVGQITSGGGDDGSEQYAEKHDEKNNTHQRSEMITRGVREIKSRRDKAREQKIKCDSIPVCVYFFQRNDTAF